MSRVTPPVTKFTSAVRRISSSANSSHPSALLNTRASRYLPRNLNDLKAECRERNLTAHGSKSELVDRLAAHDIGSHSFHTMGSHRPQPSQSPSLYKTIHLMQGFRTSAPQQAAHDTSTIDFMFLPSIPEPAPLNPYKIRVPLLPDNFHPDRSPNSINAAETLDDAVPRPEISIVASHPEDVVPANISEVVVGNDGEMDSLDILTSMFDGTVEAVGEAAEKVEKVVKEPGMIKEVWTGLVEDIMGGPKGGKHVAH